MDLLLDTHSFLWFVTGQPELSRTARTLIEDPNNDKWVSIASAWEIAIKVNTGKIVLTMPFADLFPDQLSQNDFRLLPIRWEHLRQVSNLPLHHRDPFDRLMIAQSLTDDMAVVSADKAFDAYGVNRFW